MQGDQLTLSSSSDNHGTFDVILSVSTADAQASKTVSFTLESCPQSVILEAESLSDMIHDIGTGTHSQTIVARSMIPNYGETDHCGEFQYELVNAPYYLSLTGSTLSVTTGILEE